MRHSYPRTPIRPQALPELLLRSGHGINFYYVQVGEQNVSTPTPTSVYVPGAYSLPLIVTNASVVVGCGLVFCARVGLTTTIPLAARSQTGSCQREFRVRLVVTDSGRQGVSGVDVAAALRGLRMPCDSPPTVLSPCSAREAKSAEPAR